MFSIIELEQRKTEATEVRQCRWSGWPRYFDTMPQYFAGSFYTGRKSEEQRLGRNLQSGLTKFAGRRRNFGLIWRALMRLGNFDRKFQPATTEPRCCLSFFFPIFPPLLLLSPSLFPLHPLSLSLFHPSSLSRRSAEKKARLLKNQ